MNGWLGGNESVRAGGWLFHDFFGVGIGVRLGRGRRSLRMNMGMKGEFMVGEAIK